MNKDYLHKINALKDLLQQPKNIIIITHKNPDGDAVGSCTALFYFLQPMGHSVNIIIPNNLPDYLTWLPGNGQITIFKNNESKTKKIILHCDLIFYLDFNSVSRIDNIYPIVKKAKARAVLIDHHPEPENFADILFSNSRVSSTAELVYNIIKDVSDNVKVTVEMATGLFVGIMTDTGCFAFNSSNPETYLVVKELLDTGIDKDKIYSRVYDNYSYQRMRLLGHCLKNKLQYFPEYRTGIISITKKELEEFDFKIGDTEGFVNYPLTIKNVVFSALFIEKKDLVKISFRSKGSFRVNVFAHRHFNGGGHLNAAGGESKDSLASVLDRFKNLLEEYKDELLK